MAPASPAKSWGGYPPVQVGMVPEGACQVLGNGEGVAPGLLGGDFQEGIVHLRGDGEPVPVQVRGLGEEVFQLEAHGIPRAHPEGRPWEAAPVGPKPRFPSRQGKGGGGNLQPHLKKAVPAFEHRGLGKGGLSPGQGGEEEACGEL